MKSGSNNRSCEQSSRAVENCTLCSGQSVQSASFTSKLEGNGSWMQFIDWWVNKVGNQVDNRQILLKAKTYFIVDSRYWSYLLPLFILEVAFLKANSHHVTRGSSETSVKR